MARTPSNPSVRTAPKQLLSREGKGPLYLQVVSVLRDEILRGVHAVGSKLPTEETLTERFEVSRHTIREALRQLKIDGLVSSRQGAGTVIELPGSSHAYVHEVASISDLIQYAATIRFKVDDCTTLQADKRLVARIGGVIGQQWLRVQGFRFADADPRPVCWTEVYIHTRFAGVSRLVVKQAGTVHELIEDLYGIKVQEVLQVIKASPVPKGLETGLQVEPGATAIEVIRTYKLGDGEVAQVAVNYYHADRFMMTMNLRRSG